MLVGKHISGRYKIIQLIGGGGMSNVYLAHDIILNRDVAIKILRYDFTNEEEFHRRFQREALSATSLTNPNIVSIYDVGEDEDMHYIVMEYIKGKTLKQYIQEFSPLSAARSVHIMKQLTSAIAHAHEHGIIHRDIKPQNILMDEEGNVKITDFGIATSLGATSYTQTNSVIGTVHYLSPEQARGGLATMKSDVYSLGIVFYELLTGELPFSGESAVSIALKHLQSETPSVREFDASIPQSIENIVLKATAKDTNHRYGSAEEMHADLESSLSVHRINEPKFTLPVDDGATKIIPIIKDPKERTSKQVEADQTVIMDKKLINPSIANKKQKPETNYKKKWPLFLGVAGALVILGIVLAFLLTPNKQEVPDVTNVDIGEAIRTLEEAGFVIGEQEERNNEEIEAGKVIETNPAAGLEKEKGTVIDLVVSLGIEPDVMNDFVGKQIEQVVAALDSQEVQFKDIEIIEVNSPEIVGKILSQSPAAGEEIITEDTEVVLTVSKGPEKITLINLIGNFNEANLKEYERSSGFKIHVIDEKYSNTVPAGNVMEQTPKAGTNLEKGSTVNVVLSKGPEAKREKLYRNTIEIPYEPLEEGAEQTISIYIQDKTRTMAEPFETITITESTSYLITLTIVEGDKAAYQIVRDNNVIANETITYESLE
jgi:eukaryotic-like serine/threonine-protein kinase